MDLYNIMNIIMLTIKRVPTYTYTNILLYALYDNTIPSIPYGDLPFSIIINIVNNVHNNNNYNIIYTIMYI